MYVVPILRPSIVPPSFLRNIHTRTGKEMMLPRVIEKPTQPVHSDGGSSFVAASTMPTCRILVIAAKIKGCKPSSRA